MTSIIVIAHNNARMTYDCLRRLVGNTRAPYELICVDDGSTDDTMSVFRLFTRKAQRIVHSGASVARNVALGHAVGEYIVFLDNDCFVPRGWLTGLTLAARSDPRIGILAAVPSDEVWRLNLTRSADGLIDAEEVGSACMLITRRAFSVLGFLDSELGLAGEDTDYCYRAKLAGFRVASTPGVIVRHLRNATRRGLNQNLIHESRARFFHKWRAHTEFDLIRRWRGGRRGY